MARIHDRYGTDWLDGTSEDDEFYGYGGNDTFVHSPGSDTYYGGADAHDQVHYASAGSGIWVDLRQGIGKDGEGGKEYFYDIEDIIGSQFNDTIHGDNEGNYFNGSDGNDSLFGYGGNDLLNGDRHNDTLDGGADDDTLYGGEGDDTLIGGAGLDTIYGGADIDTVSYYNSPAGTTWGISGVEVHLSNDDYSFGEATGATFHHYIHGVENVTGSAYDDILSGNADDNVLKGMDGNDVLFGRGGADTFDGGDGFDLVSYLYATAGVRVDLLFPQFNTGDADDDTLISIERLEGSNYGDRLYGDDGINIIEGRGGYDMLYGRGGDDKFLASLDDFIVDGGAGVDTVALQYTTSDLTITLDSDGDGTIVRGYGYSSWALDLRDIENVQGSEGDDTFLGSDVANMLHGYGGDDVIDGRGGNDTLFGGEDADTFVFAHLGRSNEHDSVMDFQAGVDRIDLSATAVQGFNDLINGGPERYMEQVGNDVLIHTSVSADTSILLQNVQMSSLTSADFLF